MSCDMDKGGHAYKKVPSALDATPPSEPSATVEAPLKAKSDVGEARSSPRTIEHPFTGDGDQAACLSTNNSSSDAHDHRDLEIISDRLLSEVSPTNGGEDFGN